VWSSSGGGIFEFIWVGRARNKGAILVDRAVLDLSYALEINGFSPYTVGLRMQKKWHLYLMVYEGQGPFFLRRLFSACRDMPRHKAATD
jgi:hypothetical protein